MTDWHDEIDVRWSNLGEIGSLYRLAAIDEPMAPGDEDSERYMRLSKVREKLLSDETVIAATKRTHPMISQYKAEHQQMALTATKLDLEVAFAAAFPDHQGQEEGR